MRLDRYLVDQGWFPSRERARRAILAGAVQVDGKIVQRPATPVAATATGDGASPAIALTAEGERLAQRPSRAGGKLEAALEHFAPLGVEPSDRVWLDVGAAHGGFTEVLLRRGARRVYALDVGTDQLAPPLRQDPRVVVMDRVNVRSLEADALPEPCGGIAVDVSFISLNHVVPPLLPHLEPGGWLLPLIKPQFEVGPMGVGKGGVVRNESLRRAVVEERSGEMLALAPDLVLLGHFDSPVVGMDGNRETFACLMRQP
jgi:23S rRNA (cytidine1920-2'-O)/16S rRNA (cytidine1409-2'-O)-methyltransferase